MKKSLALLSCLMASLVVTGCNNVDISGIVNSALGGSESISESTPVDPTDVASESEKTSVEVPSDESEPETPSTSVEETPSESEPETPSESEPEVPSEPSESEPEVPSEPSEPSQPEVPQVNLEFDFEKEVEIEIYTTLSATSNYGITFDDYLTKFSEIYPNISVTHTRVGGYDDVRDQLKTELGTGEGPNLAYCYPDHVALYNKARQVQTLDKFIYNTQADEQGNLLYGMTEEQRNDFIKGYWEEGKAYGDGLMYTLPLYKSTEVMYYNVDVFDELGLEIPTHWFKDDGQAPETSLEYVLEQLKVAFPDDIPLGYDSEANWFINMCEQYGSPYTSATGNHFLFNNEKNREFVGRFKDWYDRGLVTTQEIYGGYTSGLFCNTTDTTSARSYISIGSSAGAVHQAPKEGEIFEVGIAPIPQVDAINNPKVISQGPSLCLFKKADQQQVLASWLLLRYLTTTVNFQAEMSMNSGYVPVINSVMKNPIYREFIDSGEGYADSIAALSAKVCMDQESYYYTSPAFVGSSDARDQVGNLIVSVFTDNTKTIAEHFEYAIKECEN